MNRYQRRYARIGAQRSRARRTRWSDTINWSYGYLSTSPFNAPPMDLIGSTRFNDIRDCLMPLSRDGVAEHKYVEVYAK